MIQYEMMMQDDARFTISLQTALMYTIVVSTPPHVSTMLVVWQNKAAAVKREPSKIGRF
jgi:hypothetical protein